MEQPHNTLTSITSIKHPPPQPHIHIYKHIHSQHIPCFPSQIQPKSTYITQITATSPSPPTQPSVGLTAPHPLIQPEPGFCSSSF
jgi:hypothetical protein